MWNRRVKQRTMAGLISLSLLWGSVLAPLGVAVADPILLEQVAADGWVDVQVDLGTQDIQTTSPALHEEDLERSEQDLLFALPEGSYSEVQRSDGSSTLTLRVDAAGLDAFMIAPEATSIAPASISAFSQNTGLTSGTTYRYRVRAENAYGLSVYSNTVTVTTP